MDLTIDPVKLLGLDPPTGSGSSPHPSREAVARALNRRLTCRDWEAFSVQTRRAREAWLQYAADVLLERPTRAPDGLAARLVEPILMIEAGEAPGAFAAAQSLWKSLPEEVRLQGLHRSGSGLPDQEVNDLARLLETSCRRSAATLHRRRLYEQEDRLLVEGIDLLGGYPSQSRSLERVRRWLLPYRVLDLLHRRRGPIEERLLGLTLLDELIQRRGGLGADGDPDLSQHDFASFLGQIRSCLTLQEWMECCERQHRRGDPDANRPLSDVLVASGFQHRKPERILRALQLLEGLAGGDRDRSGDQQVRAWLHLLLGHVEGALQLAATQELGSLCGECQRWLAQDVLIGHRDSDSTADLEAWFEDHDVVAFIEARRPFLRAQTPEAAFDFGEALPPAPQPCEPSWPQEERTGRTNTAETSQRQARSRGGDNFLTGIGRPWTVMVAVLLGVGLSLAVQAVVGGLRPSPPLTATSPSTPEKTEGSTIDPEPPAPSPIERRSRPARPQPLIAPSPSEQQWQAVLQGWLDLKGLVLAGGEPVAPLKDFASEEEVVALQRQRRVDLPDGLAQCTLADVEDVSVLAEPSMASGAEQVTLAASIRYADETVTPDGALVGRTPLMRLSNAYRFTQHQDHWRLVEWYPLETPIPLAMLSDPLQPDGR